MAYFRTAIKNISPGFLRAGTGERYMYVIGLMYDAMMQKMVEGQLARMPLKCAPAFLPIIGSDRLIGQGITESVDSYRVRLQKAFEAWQLAGSARSVMTQALGFLLAFTPRVRVVSSRYSGNVADLLFVTAATNTTPIQVSCMQPIRFADGTSVTVAGVAGNTGANGTFTATLSTEQPLHVFSLVGSTGTGAYTPGTGYITWAGFPTAYPPDRLSSTWYTYEAGASTKGPPDYVRSGPGGAIGANWDWDSLSQVDGSWGWWGSWVIFYATAPQNWADPPVWNWDGEVTASGASLTWDSIPGSWGLSVTAERIAGLRTVVGQWKAAHTWVRWIIVSFDDGLFDPGAAAGGGVNPDGYFGRWSKIVNGEYVASRFDDAEYCDGIS